MSGVIQVFWKLKSINTSMLFWCYVLTTIWHPYMIRSKVHEAIQSNRSTRGSTNSVLHMCWYGFSDFFFGFGVKRGTENFFIFLFILNTSIVWKFQFWYHDNLKVQQRTIMKPWIWCCSNKICVYWSYFTAGQQVNDYSTLISERFTPILLSYVASVVAMKKVYFHIHSWTHL